MTSAQISFKATDTDNHVTEQVYDNINPAATPTQIRDFVQSLDDLSDDTYSKKSITVRDVVMSNTPDPKAPACYFTKPDLITDKDSVMVEFEDYGGKSIYAYFKEDRSFPVTTSESVFVNDTMYFCTDSDAKPVVSKVPTYANIVFTDFTNYVRNTVAASLNLTNDDDQLIFPTTERQIADQLNQIYYDEPDVDEIVADMTSVYAEALLTDKKYWGIAMCGGSDSAAFIGEYVISLPATVKHSAASFKFSVVPDPVEP